MPLCNHYHHPQPFVLPWGSLVPLLNDRSIAAGILGAAASPQLVDTMKSYIHRVLTSNRYKYSQPSFSCNCATLRVFTPLLPSYSNWNLFVDSSDVFTCPVFARRVTIPLAGRSSTSTAQKSGGTSTSATKKSSKGILTGCKEAYLMVFTSCHIYPLRSERRNSTTPVREDSR